MANGNGSWHDAVPTWAKTVVFIIGGLGFPVFSAMYYMAKDVGYFNSPAARNEIVLSEIRGSLSKAIEDMHVTVEKKRLEDKEADRLDQQWKEKLLHVQVESCRAASRTESQALRCDYWRK